MARHTVSLCLALLSSLCASEHIGDIAGPFATSGIKYIETDNTVENYKRARVLMSGISQCSGVVTRVSLIQNTGDTIYHEISFVFHNEGEAVCAQVATFTGTGTSQKYVELAFQVCATPPIDVFSDATYVTLQWFFKEGVVESQFLLGDYVFATHTATVASSSDPYRKNHELYITQHRSNNATEDGLTTTTCEPSAVLIETVDITPYTDAFNDADTVSFDMKSGTTGTVAYADWSGKSFWSLMTSFILQHPQELYLQNNVEITAAGLQIWQGMFNPYYDKDGVLLEKVHEMNGFFQKNTGDTSFVNPEPWVPSTFARSVGYWYYDPFDVESLGSLRFYLTNSGAEKKSMRLSQQFSNFFFETKFLANTDSATPNTLEYCIFLRINSTFSRNIEVAMYPTDDTSDEAKNKYFGIWDLTLLSTGAFEQYSRCFSIGSDRSSVGTIELEVLMGAVDTVYLVEHVIEFETVRFYQIKGDKEAEKSVLQNSWVAGSEMMTDTSFDQSSKWVHAAQPTTAAQTKWSTEFEWDVFEHTAHPANLSLHQQTGMVLRKDNHYQFTFSGRVVDNTRTGTDPQNINGRAIQFFILSDEGTRIFGGTCTARLTTTSRSFGITFFSPVTATTFPSADGTAIVTLWAGGESFGSSALNPVFTKMSLKEWTASSPALPSIPGQPALTERNEQFATPIPVSPTGSPPTAAASQAPTPSPTTAAVPDMFISAKTIDALNGVVYKSGFYYLLFNNTAVEDIAIGVFRANVSTTMIDICNLLRFDVRICSSFTSDNVAVVEVCYMNLKFPGMQKALLAADPRSCRGVGDAIQFTHPTARDVDATGVQSYLIFTFVGLDPALYAVDDEFETAVIEKVNLNIAQGNIGVRPDSSVKTLPVYVETPPPSSVIDQGDHGLPNYAFVLIIVVAALCGLGIGFNFWYQHSVRNMQRDEAMQELFKRDIAPEYHPTIMSGMGMLQLDQLGLLKQQFDAMDADDGGTLDKKEIRDVLQLLKVKVTEDEFVRFFNNIDEDGNEEIEFTEFAVGFIPFLVGQVRAHGGDGELVTFDSEADKIFAALSAEKRLSSIFEQRNIEDEVSVAVMRKVPFMEKSAARIVKILANLKARGQEADPGCAPDDTVLVKQLEVGDKVEVTDNRERYNSAIDNMNELSEGCEAPASHEEVLGLQGVIVRSQRFGEQLAFQVDIISLGKAYWFLPIALQERKGNSVDRHLSRDEKAAAMSLERWMVIRAVIAGMVSCGLTAGAELLAEESFTDGGISSDTFYTTPFGRETAAVYWVFFVLITIVITVFEVLFVYVDACRTGVKVGDTFGLILYPFDEERRFLCNAIGRSAWELGHAVRRLWCINPLRDTGDIGRGLANLAYRARSNYGAFFFRLVFKRLLTRICVKLLQVYLAIPWVMLTNGLVAKLILNKQRDVVLGPRLITNLLEHSGEGDPPPWNIGSIWVTVEHFEKLRVNILRAIGCVVVVRGEWHPCLELLYKMARNKLGWNKVKATKMETEDEPETQPVLEKEPSIDSENGDDEEEAVWDELRLIKAMRLDTLISYNMDSVDKLVQALRLDAHADMLRADQLYETDSTVSDEDYDILSSEDSSVMDLSHQISFDQNEKCLILKFLVLAIIVSGKPTHAVINLAARCFQAAGGDVTARPGKTIKSLYRLFHKGHIQQVCKNFGLIFKSHRTMKGDQDSAASKALSVLLDTVDW